MATRKTSSNKTRSKGSGKRRGTPKSARKSASRRGAAGGAQPPTTVDLHPRLRQQFPGAEIPLPEDFHALYDQGFRSARGLRTAVDIPPENAGHRRLAEGVEALNVYYDRTTQVPKLVTTRRAGAILSEPAGATPEEAALKFVQSRGDLWNLSGDDAHTIEVASVSQPRQQPEPAAEGRRRARRSESRRTATSAFDISALKTVNMVQRIEGREVFNSDVTAAVNAENQVLAVSGQFFPGASDAAPSRMRGAKRGARRGGGVAAPEEAIARAAFDLTNFQYEASDFSPAPAGPDETEYKFYEYKARKRDKRPEFERPVRVKEVMFPLSEGNFVPGYYMELWISGYPAFAYVMDSVDTPDLLYRKNLTSHAAFKYMVHNTGDAVFRPHDGPAPGTPHPTGKPDGFQAKPIPERLIQIESLRPGDPWLPANATTTSGNNCIAYADLRPPNGLNAGDVLGKVTSPRAFETEYDHSKSARDRNNLQSSLVGMFFHVNWLHDRWYDAGFDEASGNAQKDNFGRGGKGNDPILAEGNDFSGTDNANMGTPADGASPRMQMFEFLGPNPLPSRTSNHEALITFHEMGHYITNRLVGNANGLTNVQGRAMGEGWGDFFAICMTSQPTDKFANGAFAAGGWTDLTSTFKQNYYFSIRRYPYSADIKKNPLTFKHISNNVVLPSGPSAPPINPNPSGNNEVHNAGEVWCAMLWEVFVALVAKHKHTEAEKRMLAYVIGGLKLTPTRPTFVQAKDAIITAVAAMSPGDLPEVKKAFAKRGIGTGAVAPPASSESLAGVVESFTP